MPALFRRLPLHPFLFSAFPVLTLLSHNLGEISAESSFRALIFSLAGGLLLLAALWLVLRHQARAALLTSVVVLLFFSYGHVLRALSGPVSVQVIEQSEPYLLELILGLLFLAIAGLWGWLLLKKIGEYQPFTATFNLLGVFLLIYPVYRILSWSSGPVLPLTGTEQQPVISALPLETTLNPPEGALPDIYFIVLDSYTRSDALQSDFGFDNTPFLDELASLGFEVIDCSHSNYDYTMQSLSSTLNMEYLTSIQEQLEVPRLDEEIFSSLIHHNRVRAYLEMLGYHTVAFETGYGWSEITDASVYLSPDQDNPPLSDINPFEAMLLKSTALMPWVERQARASDGLLRYVKFPFGDHIRRQLSLLEQLSQVSRLPEPTFAFVHILIPHTPFVFAPDGSIRSDPGYYSGEQNGPIDKDYRVRGYTGQVQFINSRILPILKQILNRPGTPPVIILEGDHGQYGPNRFKNLSAFFVNQKARQMLYPTITPINSFRVVFNAYFGTDLPLLADESFTSKNITRRPVIDECELN